MGKYFTITFIINLNFINTVLNQLFFSTRQICVILLNQFMLSIDQLVLGHLYWSWVLGHVIQPTSVGYQPTWVGAYCKPHIYNMGYIVNMEYNIFAPPTCFGNSLQLGHSPTWIGVTQPTWVGVIQPTWVVVIQPTWVVVIQPTWVGAIQPTWVGVIQPTWVGVIQPTWVGVIQPTWLGVIQLTWVGVIQPTWVGAIQPTWVLVIQPMWVGGTQPTSAVYSINLNC